ncbi:uncharacterized protein LOC130674419 [Microplitis mediator]|uniref:uncharacterized protein LOC130674419 n=1 Tax=Microplitis mediator TaxID=375433 RepID=UPI00255213ED|nr:uncharacterized protein LOC130674419 [Microplitis mediator]
MSNKGKDCYSKIFEFIKSHFPSFNPESYMSDFEIGLHNAVEAAFPGIVAKHCYFHYAQAIIKKSNELGLINKSLTTPSSDPDIYAVVKQLIALALLPPGLVLLTYHKMKANVNSCFGNHFEAIFTYYENFWLKIIKPEGFSVYGLTEDRTNNYEESSNRTLNELLKKHPHPNQFIETIKYLALDARVVRNSINLGKYITKQPKKKNGRK